VILRLGAASVAIAAFSGLCACSHDHSVACEPTTRYATAATAAPVRIPDDLNPPDETDSLKLPPAASSAAAKTKPCLESPPGYYTEGAPAPSRTGAAAGRAPAGAPRPAAAPPAPSPAPPAPASEPAPAGSDREINN
jgi:hypothetical protein